MQSSVLCECGLGMEDPHHFFFECSLYDHLQDDLMAEVQSGWADSGNDIYLVHCTLELLLMPCMYDRLSRPSCERIISAGWNYIKRSRRQLQ